MTLDRHTISMVAAVILAAIAGQTLATAGPPASDGSGNGGANPPDCQGKGNPNCTGDGTGTPGNGGGTTTPGQGGEPGAGAPGNSGDAPAPVLGDSVVVGPATGTVLVRPRGAPDFVELRADAPVPTGSLLDARHGRVTLTSAVKADGSVQTATFWGGIFLVRQARGGGGMTELVLRGGELARCGVPARTRGAKASMAVEHGKRRARKPSRHLWGKDADGRFRTHGRNSVATVRGTRWLTLDTCTGTLTRVTRGAVAVRDKRTGRAILVKAGERYFASARTPAARTG